MANTIDEVIQYAKDHPKRDGKSWAGWCESFVWRAGGFNGSFSSALLAGNASGDLNGEWAKAPRGAIHYWAGVGGDGHVAFELGGGTLLMASSRTSNYGTALGTIHFLDYGLPEYRGWTMRHGTETLAGVAASAVASTNTPIVIDNPKESITMAEAYVVAPNKKIIHFQPGVKAEFDSIAEYNDWRSAVNFLVQHKASDLLSPPPIDDVPKVEWPVFKAFCKNFNVSEK